MENKKFEKLVKKAIKGNGDAFEALVRLKTDTIVFNSYNILRQYQDAEDAAQEIILRMYKSIQNLKDPSLFDAWLRKTIVNYCYSVTSKSSRKKEVTGKDDMFEEIKDEDREFLPQEYAETKEQRIKIRQVIQNLPEQKRLIVTMFYFDELSYQEIAYALDVPVGTVSSDLTRSKKIIKAELEKADFEKTPTPIEKPKNASGKNKIASISVLSQVLTEQVREEIPRTTFERIASFTRTNVVAGAAKSAVGMSLGKFIGVLVICSTVATTGVVYTTTDYFHASDNSNQNNIAQQTGSGISPDQYQGSIAFDGTDENEHINPDKIQVAVSEKDYDKVNWRIVNNETKKEYSGNGSEIKKEPKSLYKKRLDGTYTVFFQIEYPYGTLDLDRDFVIDTGVIETTPGGINDNEAESTEESVQDKIQENSTQEIDQEQYEAE